VIFFACKGAVQLGSQTIESEHLLLGLFREDKNLIVRLLGNQPSIENIRRDIEARTTKREKVQLPSICRFQTNASAFLRTLQKKRSV